MRAVNICILTNANIIKMSHESAHEWALGLADFYGQASEPARTPNVKVMCTSATEQQRLIITDNCPVDADLGTGFLWRLGEMYLCMTS